MILKIFRQKWWKAVAVLLLLFILTGGFLVPLSSALKSVDKTTVTTGNEITLSVTGYNTNFLESTNLNSWLRAGDLFFCSESVRAISSTEIKLTFQLSEQDYQKVESQLLDIIVNDSKHGTLALRDAISLKAGAPGPNVSHICIPDVETDVVPGFSFPNRAILYETIRNLFFHVPMWFSMILLLLFSVICSIAYLSNGKIRYDLYAAEAINVSLLYGAMGLLTGMFWANFTWGEPWPNDPRLNGAAVAVLVYMAFLVLRSSITDEIRRAKICSVYNVFAFVIYLVFIFVIPRLTDSLHPGVGGNPAFSEYDLDNALRAFFYPAVIGWALFGFWITSITIRIKLLNYKIEMQ